jgi:hypothetical protein
MDSVFGRFEEPADQAAFLLHQILVGFSGLVVLLMEMGDGRISPPALLNLATVVTVQLGITGLLRLWFCLATLNLFLLPCYFLFAIAMTGETHLALVALIAFGVTLAYRWMAGRILDRLSPV